MKPLKIIGIILAALSVGLLIYGVGFYEEPREDPKTLYMTTGEGVIIHQCNLPVMYAIDEETPEELTDIIVSSFNYWEGLTGKRLFVEIGKGQFDIENEKAPLIVVGYQDYIDAAHPNAGAITHIEWNKDGCIGMSAVVRINKSIFNRSDKIKKTAMRHEIGHLLGLYHSKVKSDLMYEALIETYGLKDLSEWELKAFKTYYGD